MRWFKSILILTDVQRRLKSKPINYWKRLYRLTIDDGRVEVDTLERLGHSVGLVQRRVGIARVALVLVVPVELATGQRALYEIHLMKIGMLGVDVRELDLNQVLDHLVGDGQAFA